MTFLYRLTTSPLYISRVGRVIRKIWFAIFLLSSVAHAQPAWQHPLGLPHGDVTYDEWVIVNKKKKEGNRDAILRQLSQHYEKDHWAAYIASELLASDKTEVAQKESNRLMSLAAMQGNPVAAAYVGLWFYRHGHPDHGKSLIETAAATGHPRAITIKAITASAPEEERLKLLKTAQAARDEVASFILAQHQLMNAANQERTLSYFSQLRAVIAADSYLSASPLTRLRRSANDSPHAIFYAAQTQFQSSKSLNINELREIESMLLDVSSRVQLRDQRSFWIFRENAALRAQTFLAGNIYATGELRNPDKAEAQLIKASNMGEAVGSRFLAQQIYHPKFGLKPDSKKYISNLELAAKQGGPEEALALATEHMRGDFVARSPRKVTELLEPFKADLSKMDEDLRLRYRRIRAEAMLELSPQERKAAAEDLQALWNYSEDPQSASWIARWYSADRSNPQAEALTEMWFERAYSAYIKQRRQAGAGALAMIAAGEALSREDMGGYRAWRNKALAVDSSQETKDVFATSDFFSTIKTGHLQDLPETVQTLKGASARGSSLADVALGFLKFSLKDEIAAPLSLEPYATYFERAIKRDGKFISMPLTAFLMQSLGPTQQDELIDWLKKTKEFHGLEEAGVLNVLLFNAPNATSTERAEALKDIVRIANQGGGFAAGFVAARRHAKDPLFLPINLNDVMLLTNSINSRLPYPDSFNLLAERLLAGDGVEKNLESAKYLLKRGAEMGSQSAMLSIAKGSMDRSFGYVDLDVALKFANLAQAYGAPEAQDLVAQVQRRIQLAESERVAMQTQVQANRGGYANTERQGSSFFSGLGSFLGTMLEIGLIVGLVVLVGAAAAPALGGLAAAPPTAPTYYAPPARMAPAPSVPRYYTAPTLTASQVPALRTLPAVKSVGLPDYSSGRAVYTTNPTPLPSTYTQRSALPSTIEIKDRSSLDPATKLRGSIAPDGSFTAKNLVGGAARGSVSETPSGKVQLEIRPKNDWDPANKFRGTLESGGDLTLRNPITGQTIKGKYDWASEYGAR
jgi:TPR repeat protein